MSQPSILSFMIMLLISFTCVIYDSNGTIKLKLTLENKKSKITYILFSSLYRNKNSKITYILFSSLYRNSILFSSLYRNSILFSSLYRNSILFSSLYRNLSFFFSLRYMSQKLTLENKNNFYSFFFSL